MAGEITLTSHLTAGGSISPRHSESHSDIGQMLMLTDKALLLKEAGTDACHVVPTAL